MPIELLSGIEHRLRHVPVESDPRESKRAIRFGERLAETLPSLPIPEDVPKLFVAQADQTSFRVEVRFDWVLLAILREKVVQRLCTEPLEVLAYIGERPFSPGRWGQPTAGQRTHDLSAADVETSQANGQDLSFIDDGPVKQ